MRDSAPSTVTLIAGGEQVNRFGTVLIHTAEIHAAEIHAAEMHEAQTRARIDRRLALLTPLVTVTLGGPIGGFIMSVMSAIPSVGELAQ